MVQASVKERKIVLGWILDTILFVIHLPEKKYLSWCEDIDTMISSKHTFSKSLHTGRKTQPCCLYHSNNASLFKQIKSFLHDCWKIQKNNQVFIPSSILDDLILCKQFLNRAQNGIFLNLISFRKLTSFFRSDACACGLGDYLEFIASVISIWIGINDKYIQHYECILSQRESTSAAGWLKKTSFSDNISPAEFSIWLIIARKLAGLFMESSTCLYSQWFPWDSNKVVDALSRDQHKSSSKLCSVMIYHMYTRIGASSRWTMLSRWTTHSLATYQQQPLAGYVTAFAPATDTYM